MLPQKALAAVCGACLEGGFSLGQLVALLLFSVFLRLEQIANFHKQFGLAGKGGRFGGSLLLFLPAQLFTGFGGKGDG